MIKLEEMVSRFLEYGLEIIDYQKVSSHFPVKCKNSSGYLGSIAYSTLRGEPPYVFSAF